MNDHDTTADTSTDHPASALEPAVSTRQTVPTSTRSRSFGAVAMGLAMLLALAGVTAVLLMTNRTLGEVRDENREMAGSIASLKAEVAALRSDVAAIPAGQVAQLPAPSDSTASAAPTAGGTAVNGLPRLESGSTDAAVGLVISNISGQDYYTGETIDYSAGDGKARAWFVWAHWCPYCQQEMPIVSDWVTAQAADHPNMEVVSITTAIDPSASNPLEPYLDAGEYPFPVLVDRDGTLSAQLGVNAFPFWVFTAPDGSVLGRTAGLLQEERLVEIFAQLEELGAEAG